MGLQAHGQEELGRGQSHGLPALVAGQAREKQVDRGDGLGQGLEVAAHGKRPGIGLGQRPVAAVVLEEEAVADRKKAVAADIAAETDVQEGLV